MREVGGMVAHRASSRWAVVALLALIVSWPAMPRADTGVILVEETGYTASRRGRYLIVELREPHRVLSTSALTGGQSESLTHLVNHQSMEPAGDDVRHDFVVSLGEEGYHRHVARELGLDPESMAMMGTAANLNYLAHVRREYRELRVDALVTAGVQGNAVRAGDPAGWYEEPEDAGDGGVHGTINIVLIVNRPLTAGAHVRAVVTLVEAKTAALMELAVPSRASRHLATGTGTDQLVVAAPLIPGRAPLRAAHGHSKLGELIGDAVREAVLEALRWQNGLERSATRGIGHALDRFGLDDDQLMARLERELPADEYELLAMNRSSVLHEPRVVAAAFAYAAVLDRLEYGTLPPHLAGEVLRDQAVIAAAALARGAGDWSGFWREVRFDGEDFLQPFVQALALGWEMRWSDGAAE